ncbi:spore germination protein [Paenibacillus sp. J5C_2022]|uniref:spore germination protein n=1 Tax=Paenibacillus sp. J5C2022 TaxID=2977129 RepID=UPI0021CF611F|nr:spore germination protein [Paenibacillus sp. J5C2022]MCU6710373.1 spore germination protein [Paenibacillus sp. J5C2022]
MQSRNVGQPALQQEHEAEQWNEERLRSLIAASADVVMLSLPDRVQDNDSVSALLIYCDGMIDTQVMNQHVLPDLEQMMVTCHTWDKLESELEKSIEWVPFDLHTKLENLLFEGQFIAFFPMHERFYYINIAQLPQRQPEESNTEISIKGARDAFTEDIATNVALIRKRLRTASLHNERFIIGSRSQTKVSLLYFADVVRSEVIEEARTRLKGIHVDALVTSGEMEEALSDSSLSIFPLLDYIGRPDFAVECLLRGRFIILIDGSPMALIAPVNLVEILKTPEDSYTPYHFIIFERFFRLLGLFISLFLPGFWIALLAYDMDQLPLPLLATVTTSRYGLPFSTPMEMLLMLVMFELFRESGIRLPKAVGQTIAVIGGLIIGESAIRAGLTSPAMLVVSAVTAVSTFTLVNQTLAGTVSLIRLYILFMSSGLGMFGFFIGLASVLAYLSTLESFGLPYLAPISPLTWKGLLPGLLAKPWLSYKKRPKMMNTVDDTRQERDHE